jgi:hypothetical protein
MWRSIDLSRNLFNMRARVRPDSKPPKTPPVADCVESAARTLRSSLRIRSSKRAAALIDEGTWSLHLDPTGVPSMFLARAKIL